MRNPRPVSVLLVATVSAGLQGGLAVFFVPTLAFLLACANAGHPAIEYGMTVAIAAPILSAACGFLMGAFMACMFNMFINPEKGPKRVVETKLEARGASVGNAA